MAWCPLRTSKSSGGTKPSLMDRNLSMALNGGSRGRGAKSDRHKVMIVTKSINE